MLTDDHVVDGFADLFLMLLSSPLPRNVFMSHSNLSRTKNIILKDHLDFIFSPSDVKTMTNMQKAKWYGGDGVVKAFDFLTKKSYSSRSVQKEEVRKGIKAQQVINKKTKRQLGVHWKISPDHPDSGSASTSSAPPANQLSLTQKWPRALSSAVAKDAPLHKKGNLKYDGDTTSSEGIEHPQPKQKNKGKEKALASDIDEDIEMTTDIWTSNESEGKVLVPDTDDDVEMSTEPPPAGPESMSPPP